MTRGGTPGDWPARIRALADQVAALRRETEDDGELDPSCDAWMYLRAAEQLVRDAADRTASPEDPVAPPPADKPPRRAFGALAHVPAEPGEDDAEPQPDERARLLAELRPRLHAWIDSACATLSDTEVRALTAHPDARAALVLLVAICGSDAEPSDAVPREAGTGGAAEVVEGQIDLTAAVAAAAATLRRALADVRVAGHDVPGDPVRAQLRGAVVRAEAALHVLRRGRAGPPLPDELRDRARMVFGAAGVEAARADAWAEDFWVTADESIGDAAPADLWYDERGRVAARALLELTLHRPLGAWG